MRYPCQINNKFPTSQLVSATTADIYQNWIDVDDCKETFSHERNEKSWKERKKSIKNSQHKNIKFTVSFTLFIVEIAINFFYSSSSQALRMFMSLIHNTFTSNHKRMRKGEKKMWHFYEIIHRKIVARIFFDSLLLLLMLLRSNIFYFIIYQFLDTFSIWMWDVTVD